MQFLEIWTPGGFVRRHRHAEPILRLVEHKDCVQNFRATSLAITFIMDPNCLHPLTRRPLDHCELLRLQHVLLPRHALLLRFARLYAAEGHDTCREQRSLREYLEACAGDKLDAALMAAEPEGAGLGAIVLLLDDYEDALQALDDQVGYEACAVLLDTHRQLTQLRKHCCEAHLWRCIFEALNEHRRSFGPARMVREKPPFVAWLREESRRL